MEVLTVRVPLEVLDDIESVVARENQEVKRAARFDPREVGRGVVIRHLLALGLSAWERDAKGGLETRG